MGANRKIVGFIGVVGSGKDHAAKFWANKFPNLKCVRVSFAAQLLEMAWNILGIEVPPEEYEQWKKEPLYTVGDYVLTGRDFLISLGMEMRKMDKEFWIKRALKKIDEELSNGADVILITDVRFKNEADMILKNGGKLQFCNYESGRYNPEIESESEHMAQLIRHIGAEHNEDITELVRGLIDDRVL